LGERSPHGINFGAPFERIHPADPGAQPFQNGRQMPRIDQETIDGGTMTGCLKTGSKQDHVTQGMSVYLLVQLTTPEDRPRQYGGYIPQSGNGFFANT
jgi:hypothetical protein